MLDPYRAAIYTQPINLRIFASNSFKFIGVEVIPEPFISRGFVGKHRWGSLNNDFAGFQTGAMGGRLPLPTLICLPSTVNGHKTSFNERAMPIVFTITSGFPSNQ